MGLKIVTEHLAILVFKSRRMAINWMQLRSKSTSSSIYFDYIYISCGDVYVLERSQPFKIQDRTVYPELSFLIFFKMTIEGPEHL